MNIPTPQGMRALGHSLGEALPAAGAGALVIGFEGELGAGKTTLVGGMLNALGVAGPVRSPTYTLVEPYEIAGRQLYHLDLYRLADPSEVEGLGVRDLLGPEAVLLIEWPSRGEGWLPLADLKVEIEYLPAGSSGGTGAAPDAAPGRVLTLRAGSSTGEQLVERLLAAMSQ